MCTLATQQQYQGLEVLASMKFGAPEGDILGNILGRGQRQSAWIVFFIATGLRGDSICGGMGNRSLKVNLLEQGTDCRVSTSLAVNGKGAIKGTNYFLSCIRCKGMLELDALLLLIEIFFYSLLIKRRDK